MNQTHITAILHPALGKLAELVDTRSPCRIQQLITNQEIFAPLYRLKDTKYHLYFEAVL